MKTRYGKHPRFIVWVLCVLCIAGCGGTTTEELLTALNRFETKRQVTQRHTSALESKYTSSANPTAPAGLDSFAEEWKSEWDKVKAEVEQLEKDVIAVSAAGTKHFLKMREITQSITSQQIRDSEHTKNVEQYNRWRKVIAEASSNVTRMGEQVESANNIYKVLKLSVMRSAVEDKIADIRKVTMEINEIVLEMEKLTAEGRTLVR